MTRSRVVPVIISLAMMAACGEKADTAGASGKPAAEILVDCPRANDAGDIEIATGLTARVIEPGYGRAAVKGDYADTNVWLWQYDESAENRRGPFVWESGDQVFQFQLGSGQVIKGWDLGVPCMKVGETRELVVAPELAYGSAGRGDAIPPNTPLIFTIELVKLTASE